jgi:hypothetical protein
MGAADRMRLGGRRRLLANIAPPPQQQQQQRPHARVSKGGGGDNPDSDACSCWCVCVLALMDHVVLQAESRANVFQGGDKAALFIGERTTNKLLLHGSSSRRVARLCRAERKGLFFKEVFLHGRNDMYFLKVSSALLLLQQHLCDGRLCLTLFGLDAHLCRENLGKWVRSGRVSQRRLLICRRSVLKQLLCAL